MGHAPDDPRRLAPDDDLLVHRIREAYDPEPLLASRRRGFDAALRERLARRPRSGLAWAALATVGSTAALSVWLLLPASAPAPAPEPPTSSELAWESAVLFPAELSDETGLEETEDLLPPDYLALASAFDL